ncbi:MAG: hypothetical protein GPOALKHO_001732 [Sodalis sp.]|nr:MAG: hypothetical protein GPOALKHO_001732 [Sodalis sp.]
MRRKSTPALIMIPRRAQRFSAIIAARGAKARQYIQGVQMREKGGLRGLMAVFTLS